VSAHIKHAISCLPHTLAAIAPWFGAYQPYTLLDASVGHLIDWYNVQFYSQGTAYTTCSTLIEKSGGDFPGTAVMEIISEAGAGVPAHKVVLGKPGKAANGGLPDSNGGAGWTQEADGNGGAQRRGAPNPHANGFLETGTLARCVADAKAKGWNGGVMVWEVGPSTCGVRVLSVTSVVP